MIIREILRIAKRLLSYNNLWIIYKGHATAENPKKRGRKPYIFCIPPKEWKIYPDVSEVKTFVSKAEARRAVVEWQATGMMTLEDAIRVRWISE